MNTEQIALALAIVREKSISKAAESLFLSQPTASIMLKNLEKELGYKLFERTRAGLILTDEGTEFIGYAKIIERSLESVSQIRQPVKRISFKVISLKNEFFELVFEKLCYRCLTENYAVSFEYQVISSTEDAMRMIENGSGDIAITVCRKNLYESTVRILEKKHLETALIGRFHLELTCNKDHPIVQNGTIAYDLFGSYTAFTSIPTSGADLYVPGFLMKYGIEIRNSIVMDPCDARYRLLKNTNGYLVSIPISKEIKESYGFASRPIEDSDVCLFVLYRKDQIKEDLIKEFITICKSAYLT